jgi:hypothetical protein
MLAEKNYQRENEQESDEEVDAEILGMGHWMERVYMSGRGKRK